MSRAGDGKDTDTTDVVLRGVWLSNVPLDTEEGATGRQVLEVELTDSGASRRRHWLHSAALRLIDTAAYFTRRSQSAAASRSCEPPR